MKEKESKIHGFKTTGISTESFWFSEVMQKANWKARQEKSHCEMLKSKRLFEPSNQL